MEFFIDSMHTMALCGMLETASLLLILLLNPISCENTIINIYALTTIDKGETGRAITATQRLFLEQLNNDTTHFPDYTFNITVFDAQADAITALKYALILINNEDNLESTHDNTTVVTLPIIFGCPWSSLSTITAPALGGFNFGQISSSATSQVLADTGNFPFFYRTPPSDGVQAQGIIKLCNEFGWDNIAIMYLNNAYGVYLAVEVLSLALEEQIETYSISFEPYDVDSYTVAAKQIHELGMNLSNTNETK